MVLRLDDLHEGSLREAERAVIVRALNAAQGQAEKAARTLGMGYSTMYRKIVEHAITAEER